LTVVGIEKTSTGPGPALAGPPLSVTPARAGRWRVLMIRGTVDLDGASRLAMAFTRAVAGGGEPLAVDVRGADPGDAGSMALLVNEMRRLHHRRPDVVIVCPPGPIRTALEETGVARRTAILDDPLKLQDRQTAELQPLRAASAAGRRDKQRGSTAARRSALVAEATLVIEARHAEPTLTLADVARDIATSSRQLQRSFAEHAGGAFRDELTAIRMQHAAVLLQTTDLSVAEVGRRTGYSHASHFARAFRRHHGVLPTALRCASVGTTDARGLPGSDGRPG
jgi:AraC-like DNA-binding protein/anti-anti-sigma regulatory factor